MLGRPVGYREGPDHVTGGAGQRGRSGTGVVLTGAVYPGWELVIGGRDHPKEGDRTRRTHDTDTTTDGSQFDRETILLGW